MKKGFVFSFDAAIAAMIAVSLVSVGLLLISGTDSGNSFREMQKIAEDASVVSSYTGEQPSDFSSENIGTGIGSGSDAGSCFSYAGKKFCGETG